ncbi:putative short-chain dehydrogenase protein [Phaeoacremonium minimum UCRPA7]|uniref:Putative short-chain dehydrogenase protein n=1 Tax=Phaeoacremonium minimum (strain UCR-PA7) TaxID=1286976 RepID=R8BF33_PHAM7|nr:putative short-chain dehydrogenase protein [Phaeoacremonium minimum UCRPA7]EON97904.1 putative short-chain dehydrogenase protein [Phaeoacremonium minimum UCRPA7]
MAAPIVALITAGSAGLGATTARLFAKNGIRVVINYGTNTQKAQSLVDELSQASSLEKVDGRVDFHAIKADLTKREDINRLVDEAVSSMGKLDVVFSNGGWTHIRNLQDLDDNVFEEDWDKCFNMNVKSHLWLMHAAKKHLDETEGAFITTASLAGVKVSGSSLAYAVTKAAQIHLAKGLAIIAAPKIRVNTVSPGLLLTDWGLQFPKERIEAMKEATKLKRLATVDDVAEQVLCFARSVAA